RWRGPFSAYIEDNAGVVSVTPQEFFCVNNRRGKAMRVDLLTKEYPPEVYGGAGVHVAELTRVLRPHLDVRVRAFGADREEQGTSAYQAPAELAEANAALSTMGTDLLIAADCEGAPGPLPHLVRELRGTHRLPAARDPACALGPLPRADAAVEGRTAGRRIPTVLIC